MKIYKYLIVMFVVSLFVACSTNNDKRYFNGKITIVDDSQVPIEKLTVSNEIDFADHFSTVFSVYDSLILFYNFRPEMSNMAYLTVCNVRSREHIGDFCIRGNGYGESMGISMLFCIYKEDGDLKAIQMAVNNGDLRIWNVTKSIESNVTVYDTIVPYDKGDGGNYHYSIQRLGHNEIFMSSRGMFLTEEKYKATLPKYLKRTVYTNEKIREYNLFTESIPSGSHELHSSENYFNFLDYAKPDGTKIAQGMVYMSQLNILDVNTGEFNGYRLKGTPGFSHFKKDPDPVYCYTSVQANDDFIYALYYGDVVPEDLLATKNPNMIHVFDWNGNIVKKLELDRGVYRMWLDNVNNILYASAYKKETIFCYDLNKIK